MEVFPFTPVGVQNKLVELYNLPDTDLFIQAGEIKLYFKKWIKDHFLLNTVQVKFLDGISDPVAMYYGEQCSTCFLSRLDIALVYSDPPIATEYSKWLGSSNTIEVKSDGSGERDISGSLTFTISYL